jgi:hypothetical protein
MTKTKIVLDQLTDDEAWALAQMCKMLLRGTGPTVLERDWDSSWQQRCFGKVSRKQPRIKLHCGGDGAFECGEALLQLYQIVFRQVARASGRDTLSSRPKRRANVGMLGGICNVAKGSKQSQAHRHIGGSVMPNLLECRVK